MSVSASYWCFWSMQHVLQLLTVSLSARWTRIYIIVSSVIVVVVVLTPATVILTMATLVAIVIISCGIAGYIRRLVDLCRTPSPLLRSPIAIHSRKPKQDTPGSRPRPSDPQVQAKDDLASTDSAEQDQPLEQSPAHHDPPYVPLSMSPSHPPPNHDTSSHESLSKKDVQCTSSLPRVLMCTTITIIVCIQSSSHTAA